MVHAMKFKIGGLCRGQGQPGAQGVAVALLIPRFGPHKLLTRILPESPPPTIERAELTAFIMVIENALEESHRLPTYKYIDVTITCGSERAIDMITGNLWRLRDKDWISPDEGLKANMDLIQYAGNMAHAFTRKSNLRCEWVPREQDEQILNYCNEVLDAKVVESRQQQDSL
nr:hypothetical protein CFP56_30996 [Quercus suber]